MSMRIVLIHPDIPQNTGNIARLCVATNCELHLVRPLGFSITDKHLKRAGLDYWKYLKLFIYDSLEEFVSNLNGNFYFFSSRGQKVYTSIRYEKNDWLIFGSETKGFPEIIYQKFPDKIFTIPMFGPVRCLNLANSVAIVVYEGIRQMEKF